MALSDYITNTLGSMFTVVGWDSADTTFVTANALRAYGVATEVEATDLTKLYALCDIELWKKCKIELATKYDFDSDGGAYKLSQMYEFIDRLYNDAVTVASSYNVFDAIGTGEWTDNTSPYKTQDLSILNDL